MPNAVSTARTSLGLIAGASVLLGTVGGVVLAAVVARWAATRPEGLGEELARLADGPHADSSSVILV